MKYNSFFPNQLVASGQGKVWYSDDDGQNWDEATFSAAVPIAQTTVRVATTPDGDGDDDTLQVVSTAGFVGGDYIAIGTAGEVVKIKKVEDADTLTVEDMADPHSVGEVVETQIGGRIEVAWAHNAAVYASMNVGGGVLWYSTDFGANFSLVANAADTPDYLGGLGWYANVIWADPENSDFVIAAGLDVYRSTTGGANLTRISDWTRYHNQQDSAHADHHFLMPHPDWPANRVFFAGNDGGIQKVSNILTAGITDWTNLANNLGITQFYGADAAPDGSVIVGGTQDNDNIRWRPTDGAQAWYQAETGDGAHCAVNPDDPDIIYAEYWGLRVEKSTNGGQTYTRMHNGITDIGKGGSVSPLTMDPNDPETLYGGSLSVWRTTNGAVSWSEFRPPLTDQYVSWIDVAHGDPDRVWVGYNGGTVSYTGNGGTSWWNVSVNGPLPDRYVTEIAINPYNWNEVFVTFGGYETDQVWFTSDSGVTWQQRTGSGDHALPQIQVNTIQFHPTDTNWVYVGTDLGVYASEDKGLTWSRTPRQGDHEGPVNTEVSKLFWQGEYLVAATHGRGMYRCRPLIDIYVDWRNNGQEDGSWEHPYNTVAEGAAAAGHGTNIHIADGDYNESGAVRFEARGRVTGYGGVVIIR